MQDLLLQQPRDRYERFEKEAFMAATYVLKQNRKGQFVFTLETHDGEVVLTSKGYADKDCALRVMASMRQMAGRNENYEVLAAENGWPYFVLQNKKKEVIGHSEVYWDAANLAKVIALVKANARAARLLDLTD
jgi:uncharacterized protein